MRRPGAFGRTLLRAFVALVCMFLTAPILMIVAMSFNAGDFLAFPPQGLSLRWYFALFQSESFMRAAQTSLIVATAAMTISMLLGTAAAVFLVRHAGPWRERLRLFLMLPLLLPEILTAIALLFFVYGTGTGIGTGTLAAMLIGHVLITFPFAFMNVASALYNFDSSPEEAARSLGASPSVTFWRVTVPLIKPGLITGALFAFIVSFDMFNMSLLLKGIGTTTLPTALFDYLRWDYDPTGAAVGSISVMVTLATILLIDRTWGLRSLRFG
ncbi:ABC transporter permease [Verminephrobacter eiseniae]|nr:ABC transporter permease [Verminephrobacter eiseniae]